jgi:hypothetical protein
VLSSGVVDPAAGGDMLLSGAVVEVLGIEPVSGVMLFDGIMLLSGMALLSVV